MVYEDYKNNDNEPGMLWDPDKMDIESIDKEINEMIRRQETLKRQKKERQAEENKRRYYERMNRCHKLTNDQTIPAMFCTLIVLFLWATCFYLIIIGSSEAVYMIGSTAIISFFFMIVVAAS